MDTAHLELRGLALLEARERQAVLDVATSVRAGVVSDFRKGKRLLDDAQATGDIPVRPAAMHAEHLEQRQRNHHLQWHAQEQPRFGGPAPPSPGRRRHTHDACDSSHDMEPVSSFTPEPLVPAGDATSALRARPHSRSNFD